MKMNAEFLISGLPVDGTRFPTSTYVIKMTQLLGHSINSSRNIRFRKVLCRLLGIPTLYTSWNILSREQLKYYRAAKICQLRTSLRCTEPSADYFSYLYPTYTSWADSWVWSRDIENSPNVLQVGRELLNCRIVNDKTELVRDKPMVNPHRRQASIDEITCALKQANQCHLPESEMKILQILNLN